MTGYNKILVKCFSNPYCPQDEVNWVLSIYYRRKIAHYLLVRQANGGFVWDTEHRYTSLHDMVRHHKQVTVVLCTLVLLCTTGDYCITVVLTVS